jgi:putative inorganic carbon (hco3(-)) transporter
VSLAPLAALPPVRAVRARPAPASAPAPAAMQAGPILAFVLFILVNAVLLIRPAEIVPQLEGIEVYFYLIAACSLIAATDVLKYITTTPLDAQPITLCVVALCVIVVLPHLVVLNLEEAWKAGWLFFKNVVYFFLFVGVVTTPGRLRALTCALLLLGAASVTIAVLDYHQILTLPAIQAVRDTETLAFGEIASFDRLQLSGIFKDPNDLCVWLAALVPLALYQLVEERDVFRRVLGVGVLLLFGYAIYLTRSRGGFLAMVAGLGVAVGMRYGRQRAALVAALGLPLLLFMFAGRQTSLDASKGTGQTRIQIWSDWLDRFKGDPILGVGVDVHDVDLAQPKEGKAVVYAKGHVAHNSFLQAFADAGFFGGSLFLGAFFVALWSLWRIGQARAKPRDARTHAMQPYVLGATAAYGVGMMTLSLWIVAPTYIVLALAASYPRIDRCDPPVAPVRFDTHLLSRFVLLGIGFLATMYVFVRVFVNWG